MASVHLVLSGAVLLVHLAVYRLGQIETKEVCCVYLPWTLLIHLWFVMFGTLYLLQVYTSWGFFVFLFLFY